MSVAATRDATTFRRWLQDGWKRVREDRSDGVLSRLEYLSEEIFQLTTYDTGPAEILARRALEVAEAITRRATYDYIKDPDQYLWFIIMVNMPFFADRIDWGISVRGAWWEPTIRYSSCGLYDGFEQLHEEQQFSRTEWEEFVSAVIEFAKEPPGDEEE